jgi:probable rRNA maturation factor
MRKARVLAREMGSCSLRAVVAHVSTLGIAKDARLVRVVARSAVRMLASLEKDAAELSVVLCGNAQIQRLNREYRRKDRPTDVLSFSQLEGMPLAGMANLLGDVVISVPTARRQAKEHGRSLEDEVVFLLAHGLLHLLGLDHRTAAEERHMNAHTQELIAASARETARKPAKVRRKKPGSPRRRAV